MKSLYKTIALTALATVPIGTGVVLANDMNWGGEDNISQIAVDRGLINGYNQDLIDALNGAKNFTLSLAETYETLILSGSIADANSRITSANLAMESQISSANSILSSESQEGLSWSAVNNLDSQSIWTYADYKNEVSGAQSQFTAETNTDNGSLSNVYNSLSIQHSQTSSNYLSITSSLFGSSSFTSDQINSYNSTVPSTNLSLSASYFSAISKYDSISVINSQNSVSNLALSEANYNSSVSESLVKSYYSSVNNSDSLSYAASQSTYYAYMDSISKGEFNYSEYWWGYLGYTEPNQYNDIVGTYITGSYFYYFGNSDAMVPGFTISTGITSTESYSVLYDTGRGQYGLQRWSIWNAIDHDNSVTRSFDNLLPKLLVDSLTSSNFMSLVSDSSYTLFNFASDDIMGYLTSASLANLSTGQMAYFDQSTIANNFYVQYTNSTIVSVLPSGWTNSDVVSYNDSVISSTNSAFKSYVNNSLSLNQVQQSNYSVYQSEQVLATPRYSSIIQNNITVISNALSYGYTGSISEMQAYLALNSVESLNSSDFSSFSYGSFGLSQWSTPSITLYMTSYSSLTFSDSYTGPSYYSIYDNPVPIEPSYLGMIPSVVSAPTSISLSAISLYSSAVSAQTLSVINPISGLSALALG